MSDSNTFSVREGENIVEELIKKKTLSRSNSKIW